MTVLGVAYHLDEPLADFDFPLPPDRLVTADLPDGASAWERMAELYDSVATDVAAAARDLDPPEREYLAVSAVRQCGVGDVEAALPASGPLYLHIDVDVVDPDELPDLLFPAPGGPALADVADAARAVLSTGRVAALGLACTWHRGSVAVDAVRPCATQLAAAL